MLFWKRRKFQLTIPFEKERNVATFYSEPGLTNHAFCAESDVSIEEYIPIVYLQAKINDDKV